MIVLDTHIWIWWVHGAAQLPQAYLEKLENETEQLGVSIISCWEVAKLAEYERIVLPVPIDEWLRQALSYPRIQLLDLSPRIVVESTQLPAPFHRDPADQLIVATARVYQSPLMTKHEKIIDYPHVAKVL